MSRQLNRTYRTRIVTSSTRRVAPSADFGPASLRLILNQVRIPSYLRTRSWSMRRGVPAKPRNRRRPQSGGLCPKKAHLTDFETQLNIVTMVMSCNDHDCRAAARTLRDEVSHWDWPKGGQLSSSGTSSDGNCAVALHAAPS